MRWFGKRRLPAESADRYDAFPVLRHPVVGGVDLTEMDSVARLNQRRKKFEHTAPVFRRQEAFDVLKDECARFVLHDDLREHVDVAASDAVAQVPSIGGRGRLEVVVRLQDAPTRALKPE